MSSTIAPGVQDSSGDFATKVLPFHGRDCLMHGDASDSYFNSLSAVAIQSMQVGAYGGFDSFCARYLRPDYVVMDVGANIGVTSLIAGGYTHHGRVVAIEASPRNCLALKKNLIGNGLHDAVVVPFAVGAAPGEIKFNEAGAHGHVLTETIALGRPGITVTVKTIDQIVNDLNLPRVDFIKLDVEGYERDAIMGAAETIERWGPLFYIEFNSWCQIALHNESPLNFYDYLLQRFSYVYRIQNEELIPLKKGEGIHFLHDNIINKGCVEDVVACTTNERLIESPTYLADRVNRLNAERDTLRTQRDAALAECDQLRVERDRVINKLGRIKHSLYWRASQPFRKLSKKLK